MQTEIEKLNEVTSMRSYIVKKNQTVKSVLKELGLETRYFAVLVNGLRADLSTELSKDDEILILPKIAGG